MIGEVSGTLILTLNLLCARITLTDTSAKQYTVSLLWIRVMKLLMNFLIIHRIQMIFMKMIQSLQLIEERMMRIL